MKRIAFASLFAFGLAAGAAQAQAPLDGTGRVPGGGSVVGGGGATMVGGGDDMVITYSAGGAGSGGGVFTQAERLARFTGSHGDGPEIEHVAQAVPAQAGREAWMIGGGDDTEVVYNRRR